MYIIGLNAYHGDASACIFKDGQLIAASEEERFRRVKHWAGFPSEAIRFCLNDAEINLSDVDYVCISRDPYANFSRKVFTAIKNRLSIANIQNRVANLRKTASLKDEFALHFPSDIFRAKIINVEHHRSHLASAFFVSPFAESALLSIDGFGDFTSTMTAVGNGNKIEVLKQVNYPHSVGVFYSAFTQYLGFPHYGDEYKVMGLAPYGKPIYVDKVREVVRFSEDGLFELNLKYFKHTKEGVNMTWTGGSPEMGTLYSDYMIEKFGPVRKENEALLQHHKDLAVSVQLVTEELIIHILNHLQKETGLKNICIAGGVAQNSVANGKIIQRTKFERMYIPPAGHDAGTAIGAALYFYHQQKKFERGPTVMHGYYGYKAADVEIEKLLQRKNITYIKYSDKELMNVVSTYLQDACVVGWYQGRAEFGPRALGHRSILVDPRRTDAKEILNAKIKRRESFRPFAPSILKEFTSEYFEQGDEVPFMERVFQIRKEKQGLIPAVTHVDGSGRLQTVDESIEPRYYQLIKAFYDKTGVPVLLNTSFNENEPIVNTPDEALDCYLRTTMDVLVLGNYVICR